MAGTIGLFAERHKALDNLAEVCTGKEWPASATLSFSGSLLEIKTTQKCDWPVCGP